MIRERDISPLKKALPILSTAYARARTVARRKPALYAILRIIKFGPFMGFRNQSVRQNLIRQGVSRGWRMLNLGSGGRRNANTINLDVTPITGPDVVGDGYQLPFADHSMSAVFCDYVIEHVPDPERFLMAVRPVLAPNGVLYLEVPFIQPLHGSPTDFSRWTRRGFMLTLTRAGYEVEQSGVHMGPAFTMFWLLKEWISLLGSFGSPYIRAILRYLLSWILCPILILDAFTLRGFSDETLACGFYFVAHAKSGNEGNPQ